MPNSADSARTLLPGSEAIALHTKILGVGKCPCGFCVRQREIERLRDILSQTIVYLDARVGNKPMSRGYALLQRLNAALIRKD